MLTEEGALERGTHSMKCLGVGGWGGRKSNPMLSYQKKKKLNMNQDVSANENSHPYKKLTMHKKTIKYHSKLN